MAKFYVVHGSVKVDKALVGPGGVVELSEAQAAKLNLGCLPHRPCVANETQWSALQAKKAAEDVLSGKAPAPVVTKGSETAKGGSK
jgi:hypothetical protein